MNEKIKEGFTEIWRFYQRNYVIPDRKEAYDRLLASSKEIVQRYEGLPIVTDFMAAVLTDIERNSSAK